MTVLNVAAALERIQRHEQEAVFSLQRPVSRKRMRDPVMRAVVASGLHDRIVAEATRHAAARRAALEQWLSRTSAANDGAAGPRST